MKNNFKLFLFFIFLLSLPEGYAHNAPGDYYHGHQVLDYKNNWMREIDNNKYITQISIPGTHNSGSIYGLFSGEQGKTQTLTIQQQLQAGIRVFDIRLGLYANTLYLYHGILYQYQTFPETLTEISQFLTKNQSEFVIIRVREERATRYSSISFDKAVYRDMEQQSQTDFSDNFNFYTVKKARGKILLLRDFDSTENKGILYRNHYIQTQDNFNVTKKNKLYVKWEQIKSFFYKLPPHNLHNIFYFNYISGSSAQVYPFFVASGHRYADTDAQREFTDFKTPEYEHTYPNFPRVNCHQDHCDIDYEGTNTLTRIFLESETDNGGIDFSGIVMMDFPGNKLIKSIINKNKSIKSNETNHGVRFNFFIL